MTKNNQTDHLVVRCQQRGIPPLVLEWLERYGDERHDHHGAVIFYFTSRAWRRLERDNGREPMRRMSEWRSAYLVMALDGTQITAGHRYKRLFH